MKNVFKRFCFIAVMGLAVAAPVFSGGIVDRIFNGGAKSLAKQAVNLIKQAAALEEKAAGIEERVLALSDKDRRTYQAELERLGFVPPVGLFNDGEALLTGAPEAPEGPGGILGFLAGIFGGGSRNGGGARNSGANAPTSTITTLNGVWLFGNGTTISINGSIGVFTQIGSGSARFHDAVNKGLIGVGVQCLRDLRKTGDLTWTGQELGIGFDSSTPDVAATVDWFNTTITLSANGQSFYSSAFGNSFTNAPPSTTSSGSGGTFTLTGIPSQYNGKYAYFTGMGQDGREAVGIIGVQSDNLRLNDTNVALTPIRNGRVTLPLWRLYANAVDRYTGNDTLRAAGVIITNQTTIGIGDDPVMEIGVTFENVSFRNGSAERAWRNGTVQEAAPPATAPASTTTQSATPTPAPTPAPASGGPSTWTAISNSGFGRIRAIAWGNNRFVAVGSRGQMAYSTDGASWTAVADSTFGTSFIFGIAWSNNRFVAVGSDGKMAYSANGQSWTAVADSTFGTSEIWAVAFGNNRFVAVGSGGKMAYSANGQSWTAVTNSGFGSSDINAVAYGGNRWVAVGDDGKLAYSANGQSWTAVTGSIFGTSIISAIIWGNNRFVAGGAGGKIAYSADGASWTAVADSTIGNYTINAIAWGNNRFVAGGWGGRTAYSSDGVSWTAGANTGFGTSDLITAIAYANNRFVAVSQDGRMAYCDW